MVEVNIVLRSLSNPESMVLSFLELSSKLRLVFANFLEEKIEFDVFSFKINFKVFLLVLRVTRVRSVSSNFLFKETRSSNAK